MDMPTHKVCSACSAQKLASEFRARATSRDGLQGQCRDCMNRIGRERGHYKGRNARAAPNGRICKKCNKALRGAQLRYCSLLCKRIGGRAVRAGQVFGNLTTLRPMPSRPNDHSVRWLCRCSCGVTKAISTRVLRADPPTRTCGNLTVHRSRADHPRWHGGYTIDDHGYAQIKRRDHPNANKAGYVREHVLVMSEHLGRPLGPKETVHHRNGIRHDNRLENLELWASRHPRGQRVSDIVAFCREFLEEHGYSVSPRLVVIAVESEA